MLAFVPADQNITWPDRNSPAKADGIEIEKKPVEAGRREPMMKGYLCKRVCLWYATRNVKPKAKQPATASQPQAHTPVNPRAAVQNSPQPMLHQREHTTEQTASQSLLVEADQGPNVGDAAGAAAGETSYQQSLSAVDKATLGHQKRLLSEELQRAIILGNVESLSQLLSFATSNNMVEHLPTVKDQYGRNLLSLCFSKVTTWPPDLKGPPIPQAGVDWIQRLDMYKQLVTVGRFPQASSSNQTAVNKHMLCRLSTHGNNKCAVPLHQLLYFASDEDWVGGLLGSYLEDLESVLQPQERLEILQAQTMRLWSPYHNAISQGHKEAVELCMDAILKALVEREEHQAHVALGSKRRRFDLPLELIQNEFYHLQSDRYKNGSILNDALAKLLQDKYGKSVSANTLELVVRP